MRALSNLRHHKLPPFLCLEGGRQQTEDRAFSLTARRDDEDVDIDWLAVVVFDFLALPSPIVERLHHVLEPVVEAVQLLLELLALAVVSLGRDGRPGHH